MGTQNWYVIFFLNTHLPVLGNSTSFSFYDLHVKPVYDSILVLIQYRLYQVFVFQIFESHRYKFRVLESVQIPGLSTLLVLVKYAPIPATC